MVFVDDDDYNLNVYYLIKKLHPPNKPGTMDG